jgi:hypothetical protein
LTIGGIEFFDGPEMNVFMTDCQYQNVTVVVDGETKRVASGMRATEDLVLNMTEKPMDIVVSMPPDSRHQTRNYSYFTLPLRDRSQRPFQNVSLQFCSLPGLSAVSACHDQRDCVDLRIAFSGPLEWNENFAQALFRARSPALFREAAHRLFRRVFRFSRVSTVEYRPEFRKITKTPEFERFDAVMKKVLVILNDKPLDENETELAGQIQEAADLADCVLVRALLRLKIKIIRERLEALNRTRASNLSLRFGDEERIAKIREFTTAVGKPFANFSMNQIEVEANVRLAEKFDDELRVMRQTKGHAQGVELTRPRKFLIAYRSLVIKWINAHRGLFMWAMGRER